MSEDNNRFPVSTLPKLPRDFLRLDLAKYMPLFNNTIRQRGTRVRWTPHVICPCVQSPRSGGNGRAVPDCPECSGTGFAYVDDESQIDRVVVSGVSDNGGPDVGGYRATGVLSCVFPAEMRVSEGDRLQLLDNKMAIRFARTYKQSVGGMRLPFDVQEVKSLVTNDPHTYKILPLKPGADYSLNVDRNYITFNHSSKISDNSRISGVFLAAPYYILHTLGSNSRGQYTTAFSPKGEEEWVDFPQSGQAMRSDLFNGRFEKEVSSSGDADSGEGH